MGSVGQWNFYKISDTLFPAVNLEFANAKRGIVEILEEYIGFVDVPEATARNGVLTLFDNKTKFLHKPFADLDYRISTEAQWQQISDIYGASQSRVVPTAVLFNGIGREHFSKLPGSLGNMLIHSTDIDRAIFNVSQALNIDRESYFQKAKGSLDYSTGIGNQEEEREDVFNILDILPKTLKRVKSERSGVLALVTWEGWYPKDENYYRNLANKIDEFPPKIRTLLLEEIHKQLENYRIDREVEVLESPTTLSGEDVLPGFSLDIRSIFS